MNETLLSNRPAGEAERLVQAVREALTDSMVERLSVTGANALEIVDRLNDEGTRDAIHDVIDKLTELHRIGAINTLFETVALLHAAKSASTDSIIERLFTFIEHMVNNVGHEDFATMVDNARQAMDDAVAETAGAQPSGGLFSTLGMLSKPETQRSQQFLLSFSSNLQRRATEK
jgi:uncharacterized protein YjgD (DUF1641 family)